MSEMGWGSDAIAALLREMNFKYAALVPGASYRGLHDSIVNYLGNENPEMLLCLHEEHAVAIAHGYAKVTEEPMLAIVHSNVGLMHATMAFFNAWCDRSPVVVLGATGPVDAMKRRPWIDWIHTSADQGALVRSYTKWDDQPGSPAAALESIVRANQIASTRPHGPTYICLDVWLQEEKLPAPLPMPDLKRFKAPEAPVPSPADVQKILSLLKSAKKPIILMGRLNRKVACWNERIALVEALNARVITNLKTAAVFPSNHPLNAGPPGTRLHKESAAALREADVILNLDTIDMAGMFKETFKNEPVKATIVSASLDRYIHNGWSMDYQALPPVDLDLACDPDLLVTALYDAVGRPAKKAVATNGAPKAAKVATNGQAGPTIGIREFSQEVCSSFAGMEVCYIRLPLGVNAADFPFNHPLDYLGGDGGGGVGGGPGQAVGAALALRGTGRLPVAVLGDGDTLMGIQAFWTAVQNKIPLLVVVSNNHSYFNDEVHQERMAVARNRDVARKWIGQRIDGPPPDIAMMARAQGALGIGPVLKRDDIKSAIAEGIKHVQAGGVALIDVIVSPEYDASVAAGVVGASVQMEQRGGVDRG